MAQDEVAELRARLDALETEVSRLHALVSEEQGGNLERLNAWRREQIFAAYGPRRATGLQNAFNGQISKYEIFEETIVPRPMRFAVETGTFLGWTTRFLAGLFQHVVTFEADGRYRDQAMAHCSVHPNISFVHGDSGKIAAAWRDIGAPLDEVDFAYLDAHWQDYCPLNDELSFLLSSAPNAIIMIDDFEVAGDPGYGFDAYPSMALTLPAISDVLSSYDVAAYVPTRQGVWDTSIFEAHQKPRGTLVVASARLASQLDGAATLRRVAIPR